VKGFKYSFSFDREQPAVKEMISLGFFYLTVIIAAQFNVIVDRIIASYLVPGSIAALGYAGKLIQAPIMIFSSSIATAVFPFFSAQAVKKQIEEMEDSLTKSITMSCFIFIPLTVMLIILARPALQLLFQRGAFDKHATDLTSISFICYSLQLFPVTVWMILSRAYLAFQDIATLLRLAILSLVANLVLNLVFIKIITPPVAGIALATSVVYFVVMLLGFQALKQKMFHLRGKHILKESMKIAIGSCAMGLSVVLVYGFLKDIGIVSYNISQLIRLIAAVLTGIVVFALVSFLSGVREFNKLMRVIFLTNKFMGNL
jgi:putative peptidoglycan lipid II flippase